MFRAMIHYLLIFLYIEYDESSFYFTFIFLVISVSFVEKSFFSELNLFLAMIFYNDFCILSFDLSVSVLSPIPYYFIYSYLHGKPLF